MNGPSALQLHTGDYAPYAEAAQEKGFAFLEYDVGTGGGVMEVLIDAIEVNNHLPRSYVFFTFWFCLICMSMNT